MQLTQAALFKKYTYSPAVTEAWQCSLTFCGDSGSTTINLSPETSLEILQFIASKHSEVAVKATVQADKVQYNFANVAQAPLELEASAPATITHTTSPEYDDDIAF